MLCFVTSSVQMAHQRDFQASCTNSAPSKRSSVPPVQRKALCIGIGYHNLEKTWHLRKARKDTFVFRRFLSELYGFNKADVMILTDNSRHIQPTRKNIMMHIDRLVENTNPGDRLVFFFSGHGSQVPNKDGTEIDGYDEVIWPSDVKLLVGDAAQCVDAQNYIIDDDLKRHLVDSIPKGAQLTALLDCCHSGTGLDLPHTYSFSTSDDGTLIPRTDSPIQIPTDQFPFSDPEKTRRSSSERPGSRPLQWRPKRAPTKRQTEHTLNMPFLAFGRHSTEERAMGTIETKSRKNSMIPCNFSKHVTSWSACLDDQLGIECPDGGLLTQAFVKAIRENPNVTYEELLNALTRKLSEIGVIANESLRKEGCSLPCPVPSLGSLRPINEILKMNFTF